LRRVATGLSKSTTASCIRSRPVPGGSSSLALTGMTRSSASIAVTSTGGGDPSAGAVAGSNTAIPLLVETQMRLLPSAARPDMFAQVGGPGTPSVRHKLPLPI
jgi:hypothetical protein